MIFIYWLWIIVLERINFGVFIIKLLKKRTGDYRHGFKNRTGERTGKGNGSCITGPTGG
jgi:hypothetical protein